MRLTLLILGLVAVAALTSCGGHRTGSVSPPAVITTTATATAAPTVTTTEIPPVSAPARTISPTPAPFIAGAACRDGQVRTSSAKGSGAGGSFYGHESFTLIGTTPCTLTGYPGLNVVTTAGTQPAKRDGYSVTSSAASLKAVTLSPTAGAAAQFYWGETPPGRATSCPRLIRLIITPPGLYASAFEHAAGWSGYVCGQPRIGYITAG